MLEQDYLVKMFSDFASGIRRSLEMCKNDPQRSIESLQFLVAQCIHLEAGTLFSLDAESFASLLDVMLPDKALMPLVSHSLVALGDIYEQEQRMHDAKRMRMYYKACVARFGACAQV